MKFKLLFLFLLLFSQASLKAQVGIGTTNPDPSSILDISSTSKGFIAPRIDLNAVTNNSIDGENANANGLMIFNTNAAVTGGNGVGYYFWDGSAWIAMKAAAEAGTNWSLSGNEVTASDFLGTLNKMNLPIRTNNVERFSFTTNGQLTFLKNGNAGGIMIGEGSDGDAGDIAIGDNTLSRGSGANIAIGSSATANKPNTIALGKEASAIQQSAMAIGQNSEASGVRSLSFGMQANASGDETISIGVGTVTNEKHGIAIGARSKAKDYENTLAIGTYSIASASNSVAIGQKASAVNPNTIIFGDNSGDTPSVNVGIGTDAPTAKLQVNGSLKFVDGNQAAGKVLTSDANGNASWQVGVSGMQFYAYDINNVSSPDLNNLERDTVITKAGYYNGALSLPASGSSVLDPTTDGEGFVVKLVGTYFVKNTGNFTFSQLSDDGVRIYIDGSLVLNDWIDSSPGTTTSNAITLARGKHRFEFWYYEDMGGQEFSFSWGSNPDGNSGVMQANQFTIE